MFPPRKSAASPKQGGSTRLVSEPAVAQASLHPGFPANRKDNSTAETGKTPAPAGAEIRRKAEPDASLRSISRVAASAPFPPSLSSLAISSGHLRPG